MNPPIHTYILSGFLGAGKTTLLNQLLKLLKNDISFVIENEFGEVNIDSQLIIEKYQQLFEVTNGCICCNENDDLYSILEDIFHAEQMPNNLFIEATGIANPYRIAETLVEPSVKKIYNLRSIVTVIDYVNFEETYQQYPEVKKQIVAADVLYINKKIADKVCNNDIETKLKSINPLAKIVYQPKDILSFTKTFEIPITENYKKSDAFNHQINSVLFKSESKINFEKLKQILTINMYMYFDSIYRIKGFVIDQYNHVHSIQTVGKIVTIEPVKNTSIKNSQLVFIGQNLKSETIHRILRTCLINNEIELSYL